MPEILFDPLFQEWHHWMVELLSVACLSVASKFNETDVPSLDEIQVTIHIYTDTHCSFIFYLNIILTLLSFLRRWRT